MIIDQYDQVMVMKKLGQEVVQYQTFRQLPLDGMYCIGIGMEENYRTR